MPVTLIPLLVVMTLGAMRPPLVDSRSARGMAKRPIVVADLSARPVDAMTTGGCPASDRWGRWADTSRCFQLSARRAVAIERPFVARSPSHDDRWASERRIAGATLPAMRSLLGLGASGIALIGRVMLTRGAPVRLGIGSVVDPRPGDGVHYDQAVAAAGNDRLPGRPL